MSEPQAAARDGVRVDGSKPPRPVAGHVTWGVVLVVLGLVLLVAAVHQSLYDGGVDAASQLAPDGTPVSPVQDTLVLAVTAVLVLVAGTWLLAVGLHELVGRSDRAVGAVPRGPFVEPSSGAARPAGDAAARNPRDA